MKKKISIKDIAHELGISTTTVSFILNGRAKEKRISEDRVKEVKDFIHKVGYKPSTLARSFRTGRTHIIGLMVEDMSNAFFATIAKLIEEKSYQNGYKIIYCSTEDHTEKAKELLKMYEEWHVDGYIIVPPIGIERDLSSLMKNGKPVLQLDRRLSEPDTDTILINNSESAYQATWHLANNHYNNIALITLDTVLHQMKERLSGYLKAVEEAQLPSFILKVNKESTYEKQIASFLRSNKNIDALLFGTNYLGLSGLKAIKELKIKVPQEMGVVCFDDHDFFDLLTPSITSIAQPLEKIAENTIKTILDRLKQDELPTSFKHSVLSTSLIIRDSSKRR